VSLQPCPYSRLLYFIPLKIAIFKILSYLIDLQSLTNYEKMLIIL